MNSLPENLVVIVAIAVVFTVIRKITGLVFKIILLAALVAFIYYVYTNKGLDYFFTASATMDLLKGPYI